MKITVYVKGTPRPQPRPRIVNGHAISTGSKVAKTYKATVLAACRAAKEKNGTIEGPVHLDLELWFAYGRFPERDGHWHVCRPDEDNVVKLWQDCAQKAGLIQDDSHVALLTSRKIWAATAGALMVLSPLSTVTMRDEGDEDDLGVLTEPCDVV